MDIAAMNVRIAFQKSTIKTDDIGNHTTVWEDFFSCWATYSSSGGAEKLEAGTVNAEDTNTFTTRYCSELSGIDPTKIRIRMGSSLYNVLSIDPMSFHHRSLKFKCEKVKR